jgi:hypothetical protein
MVINGEYGERTEGEVIHLYGKGDPRHLFDLIKHHAEGVGDLIAPISVVVLDVLGRDDQEHEMHIGGGWNSVNLHLANGEKIAIRAHTTAGRYDHVKVFSGAIRGPQRKHEMDVRTPKDVARFHRELKKRAKL